MKLINNKLILNILIIMITLISNKSNLYSKINSKKVSNPNQLDTLFDNSTRNIFSHKDTITLSADGVYSTSYAIAGSICNKINKAKSNTKCNVYSLDYEWYKKYSMLSYGKIDFLLSPAPMESIYRKKYKNLESITHVYKMYSFLLSKNKKSIYQFKSGSIGVLKNDTMSKELLREIIQIKDQESMIKKRSRFNTVIKTFSSLKEGIFYLCEGKIDGIFILDTYPSDMLQSATEICKLHYVDFKYKDIQSVLSKVNDYQWTTLLKSSYNNIRNDIGVFYTNVSLLTNSSKSKDKVCIMTKAALAERSQALDGISHPSVTILDLKNLGNQIKYPLNRYVRKCAADDIILKN